MTTLVAAIILAAWLTLSLPLAILFGRMCARRDQNK